MYIGELEPLYNIEVLLAAGAELEQGSLVLAVTGSLADTVDHVAATTASIHYLGTIPHETTPGLLGAYNMGCLARW